MSLLNSASLCVTPNAYKEGTLYSVIPNTSLGDMTVVRATTATRVNSAGLIELVPYNLIEYSEQFNNAAWSTQDATITANSTTAPNGTLTADTFTRTANTAFLYATNTFSLITGSYSISVYAKANTTSSFRLDLGSSGFSQGVTCTFNLSTATAGTPILYGSASSFVATIENVGNGWYRCSLSGNLISANYYAELAITTTGSIYIWGAQLVTGTLPKDYLRTETRLNIPRLDYSNGSCPSLLVEPQRTNLVLYSEQFDNAAWTKGNGTITANATTSPDGTANADKFAEDTSTDAHYFGNDTATATSGQSVTFTIFAKASERSWIAIRLYSGASSIFGWYNIGSGTLGTIGAGGTGTIENYSNGWYRCSLTITMASNSVCLPYAFSSTGNGTITFTGTSGSGFFAWGAQAEIAYYSTSYIPTTSAAVTRNADVISKTGISSLIGQTEGTLFIELDIKNTGDTRVPIIISSANPGTSTSEAYFYINGAGNLLFEFYIAGIAQCSISAGAIQVGVQKLAFVYKNNDFAFYRNGTQVGVDTSGTVGSGLDRLYLGCFTNNALQLNDRINSAVLFPTRLTNAELISLTTL